MRPLLLTLIFILAALPARAEKLTIALSTSEIDISASFTGLPLTLFGVIEGDDGGAPPATSYQVAVMLLGPRESVVVRRKDRVLGIWANAAAQTIIYPPSFYSLSTSTLIDNLAPPETLQRLQIGFDNIAFVYEARAVVNDPGAEEFRDAFIRLKQEARLYEEDGAVGFIGNTVFRTTAFLPANLPVGSYTAIAYLFSGGELIARAEEKVQVSKTGFEARLAGFARNQSLAYGFLCVTLAVFIGWLGGVIFRRD